MKITDVKLGHTESYKTVIGREKVDAFGKATGDYNPVHFDEDFCAGTMFKKPIAHGMLTGSLFSTIFGTVYPGEGSIYAGQSLKFLKPVYIGEELTAEIVVKEVIEEKKICIIETTCYNNKEEKVVTGEATIYLP